MQRYSPPHTSPSGIPRAVRSRPQLNRRRVALRALLIPGWWLRDYASALSGQLRSLIPTPTRNAFSGDPEADRVSVLLLPGVYERWRFLLPLCRALRTAGFSVTPAPELGWNRQSLTASVDCLLDSSLSRLPPQHPVIVIGHSKGGLIGRSVLDDPRSPLSGRDDVALLTIATPFRGSRYASWFLDPAIRQLRPRDPSVSQMLGHPEEANARITALVPHFDPHVPSTEALPGARTLTIPVAGHFWSVRSRTGIAHIIAAARDIRASLETPPSPGGKKRPAPGKDGTDRGPTESAQG